MTREKPYTEQFFDNLKRHLVEASDKLDTNKTGGLKKTQRNTQHVAHALRQTFCDMGDIAGMIGLAASCDFSLIEEVKA